MAQFDTCVEWCDCTVSMSFTANMVWDDYGVPGSPRWLSPEDIKWGNYDVDGVEMNEAQMVDRFGKDGLDELNSLLEAELDDAEWDDDYEPDYEPDDRDDY